MRIRRLAATFAMPLSICAAPLSAYAQEGPWGDSSAARYNAPMGYASQAAFNGPPVTSKREALRNPRIRKNDWDPCNDGPGETGVDPDRRPEFPISRCVRFGGVAAPGIVPTETSLTVVTTGAWNTVIVETKRTKSVALPAALNGGLDLD